MGRKRTCDGASLVDELRREVDSSLAAEDAEKHCPSRGQKVLVSAIAFFSVCNLTVVIQDFLAVVLYHVCYASCAAVADLEIISVEYPVEFMGLREMFINQV